MYYDLFSRRRSQSLPTKRGYRGENNVGVEYDLLHHSWHRSGACKDWE